MAKSKLPFGDPKRDLRESATPIALAASPRDKVQPAREPAAPLLINQFYEPKAGDILYHYCPVAGLEAILRTGTIRFSDINMLNDAAEMRWGYSIFTEAANRLLTEPRIIFESLIDRTFLDAVDSVISSMALHVHMVTASFSKHADDLSQWRAYANNGEGVAIGFSGMTLGTMPTTMLTCLYDPEQQIQAVRRQLIGIAVLNRDRTGAELAREFRYDCEMLAGFLPAIKHPSFESEAEVRGVHMLTTELDPEKSTLRLDDPGGEDETGRVEGQKVEFRVRGNSIVPFVDIPFGGADRRGTIEKIVLGPRNPNGFGNILAMLTAYGYEGVNVVTSASTYRG